MSDFGRPASLNEGWRYERIGDVITSASSGSTPKAGAPQYYDRGTIPFLKIGDLNDGIVAEVETLVTPLAVHDARLRLRPAGTVLLAMYGSVGKTGMLGIPATTNQAILALDADRRLILPEYLHYALINAQREFIALSRGATQKNINKQIVEDFRIPVPPVHEQSRIIDLVGSIDEQIVHSVRHASGAASLLDGLRRAATSRHPEKPLGSFLLGIEGGRSLASLDRPPESGERAVLKVSAVRPSLFVPEEAKALPDSAVMPEHARVERGDVLITRANTADLVGAVCTVDQTCEGLYLSDKTLRLIFDDGKADSGYFVHALSTNRVRQQLALAATGTSGSMKNISQDKIGALLVGAPTDVSEQRELTTTLDTALQIVRQATDRSVQLRKLRLRVISSLLSSHHSIPDSYDRFLNGDDENPAGATLEPATV